MRRTLFAVIELLVLSALILATRCANYREVFVKDGVYFTDADCYARMTRVRMCLANSGEVIRHHSFENFPAGTAPHTTAPFDYLVAALSVVTPGTLDVAGAIVSPLLALLTGWFLWWWSRKTGLPYRGVLLLLFAASPILVHATELGRPDHQSLLLGLIAVVLCAEWTLASVDSRSWSLTSGAVWGLALWVSIYEPLILLAIVVLVQLLVARKTFLTKNRAIGWATCAGILLVALLIERRLPSFPAGGQIFSNWAVTIGELRPVWPNDAVWARWTGLLILPFPALLWIALRRTRTIPLFLAAVLIATFLLTVWQARWAYFFALTFALALTACLVVIRNRIAGWLVVLVSLYPILKDWDERIWPNEFQAAVQSERRAEVVAWRDAASHVTGPFLAPWWWSPAVAYWSGQPGIAGSSHESLPGIGRTARFSLATDPEEAKAILQKNQVKWVLAYDADRTMANSAAILGVSPPENALGRILDRTPSQAPAFLQLAGQNSACKLFRVDFFKEKEDFRR